MAIEVSSSKKRASASPQWLDRVLYAGVIVFLIAGGLAGFIFWANRNADKEKERITALIEEAESELKKRSDLEREIIKYAHLVGDFKTVTLSRRLPSKFFDPFQKAVHPKVEVYKASISLEDGLLQFEGVAQNLTVIGQQFGALKNIEYISSVILSSVSVVESDSGSRINFSITGILDTEMLKKEYAGEEKEEEGDYGNDEEEEEEEIEAEGENSEAEEALNENNEE